VDDGEAALAILRKELLPLCADIYARLASRPELPHAERINARAAEFAAVLD